MTLIHVDGAADLLGTRGKYWSGGNVGTPGRSGSGYYVGSAEFRAVPAEKHATWIIGFAYYWDGGPNFPVYFASEGRTVAHVEMTINAAGQLEVRRGLNGTILATSAMAAPFVPSVWRYIEMKATLSDTVGAIVVHVDEVEVINISGVDTKNGGTETTFDSYQTNRTGSSSRYGDVYLCTGDGVGASDFLGDCVVATLLPTNNGNSSVLVGSDGNSVNNYALVNEATPDSSNYVGSANTGDKDTYVFADIVYAAGTVKGVVVSSYAAKSDAGARSMRAVTRSGGTDYAGSDKTLSTTYTTYKEILETNPATAAAWTITDVNNAEFGFEARA